MDNLVKNIVDEVVKRIKDEVFIKVEASGRHVHLSRAHVDVLFGKGYELTKVKDLSQPGQYACKERVSIKGAKGIIHNVVVLGPVRPSTQVEVSLTDSLSLGVKAQVRQSGDITNTNGIEIFTEKAVLKLEQGLIAAKRHIHVNTKDAKRLNVKDNEIVKTKVFGERPLIFDDVIVRINDSFSTAMHIDYDEANACGLTKESLCRIIK